MKGRIKNFIINWGEVDCFNERFMVWKTILVIIFILGLIYLIVPGPKSIYDFPGPPGSVKSDEPGDTYQNPNIAGYYGDKRRKFVTEYYKNYFDTIKILGFKIPSMRLNHPPEDAYKYLRDQQTSTYLEEFTYPLRGSIFVNGYEPYSESGKRFNSSAYPLNYYGNIYPTKVTIRYYYAPTLTRLFIYTLYWILGIGIFYLWKRVLKDD